MANLDELQRQRKRDLLERLELKNYLKELTDSEEIESIKWRIFELSRNIDYLSNEIYKEKTSWSRM